MTNEELIKKILFKNSTITIVTYSDSTIKAKVATLNTYDDLSIENSKKNINFLIEYRLSFDMYVYYGKTYNRRIYHVRFTEDTIAFSKIFTKFTEYDRVKANQLKILESI